MVGGGTVKYVRMPKTGSSSIASWLIRNGHGKSHGHAPGRDYSDPDLWGTVRHPLEWYASWWGHMRRGHPMNHGARSVLSAYGRGSTDFRPVLYGMTHPADVDHQAPIYGHLYSPAGELTSSDGGLWSRAVRWFFTDSAGHWIVRPVHLESAEGFLAEHYPGGGPLDWRNMAQEPAPLYDREMIGWVAEADGAMWTEVEGRCVDRAGK